MTGKGECANPNSRPWIVREHQPGDIGWIVAKCGQVYPKEYKWNILYESEVCKKCADFIDNFDPSNDRCWIAELDGQQIGSIALRKDRNSPGTALLNFLVVDKEVRGLGVAKNLIQECLEFAKEKGYKTLRFRTFSDLQRARQIYARIGFKIVEQEENIWFGKKMTLEYWEAAYDKAKL